MNKLRMRFSKTGRAIYISHLDLMQTIQRAFNRAGYELAYSEGFNPHPIISIALPLSVGAASECELMDFRLREQTDLDQMPERLTAAMPEGIVVSEVYEPSVKLSSIKWLRISGTLEYDNADTDLMAEKLTSFFQSERIEVEKKSKKGMLLTDIRPGIKEILFTAGERAVYADMILSAAEPTINPDLLIAALRKDLPDFIPDFSKFLRLETYDSEMHLFR